ncbi:MAG: DUF1552 domain-containing protein [Lentisphaeraceae bacterium]|nr:DUF1552 domain-containing protein [Lentisphaeraceae bacterium]
MLNRRNFIKASSSLLPLPLIAQGMSKDQVAPKRLVIVGNEYGMHPDSFFPKDFGKDFTLSHELSSFGWIKDRMTVFSHTDHGMEPGHGKEDAFLNGILKRDASNYADGNVSVDQLIGERFRSIVRFPTINIHNSNRGISESWTRNSIPIVPLSSAEALHRKLFVNQTLTEKKQQKVLWDRNRNLFKAISGQYKSALKGVAQEDRERLSQYRTAINDLGIEMDSQEAWLHKEKPNFKFNAGKTIKDKYNAIFDMTALALQTDQTRVASISFSGKLNVSELVERGYHSCTHNGKGLDLVSQLVTIEKFQLDQISRFMKKLDAIKEPNSNGTMLDNTIVMFGSGMGHAGTHINRNLPIALFGGGLDHKGHISLKRKNGENTPLCNLYLSLINKMGIERDYFNVSTGTVDI